MTWSNTSSTERLLTFVCYKLFKRLPVEGGREEGRREEVGREGGRERGSVPESGKVVMR